MPFGTQSSTDLDPYDIQLQQINRRRAIADAMIAQSMQPIGDTQMVSGLAVRRSPLEGISKLVNAYVGAQTAKGADVSAQELSQKRRADVATALEKYQTDITPRMVTPSIEAGPKQPGELMPVSENIGEIAQSPPLMTSAGAIVPQVQAQPAQPYMNVPTALDRRNAAMNLATSMGGDPREYAKLIVANALSGNQHAFGKIDFEKATPESIARFQQTGDYSDLRARTKMDIVQTGGESRAVDPYAIQPGTVLPHTAAPAAQTELSRLENEMAAIKQADPNDPRIKTYQDAISKATTHQPATNVNVNTEKTFYSHLSEKLGENVALVATRAQAATGNIQTIHNVRQLLDSGIITGFGAKGVLKLGEAAQRLGFNADDPRVANTQAAVSQMAKMTLDNYTALRNQGQSGGMRLNDKTLQLLQQAAGGDISLEAPAIRQILDLNEQSQRTLIDLNSRNMNSLKASGGENIKGLPMDIFNIAQPAPYSGGDGGNVTNFRRVK